MTEEEARELGWGDEARDFVLGRETAAAILAAIPESKREPVAEAAAGPPMSETEARALALAEQLTAESALAEAKARTQRHLDGVRVVTMPAGPPSAAERRRWALRQAAVDHPRVISPGAGMVDVVYQLPQPDGSAAPRMVRQDSPTRTTVILPGEWDAFLTSERARMDREGDDLLIKAYGEQACRADGILSWQVATAPAAEPTLPRAWNANLPRGVGAL